MAFLNANSADPATFLFLLFIYVVLAAIILPIPLEIAIALNPAVSIPVKALVVGLGKGVGAVGIFYIGATVDDSIQRWRRWGWFDWLVRNSVKLVDKLGYLGLFILLVIPGMADTVPLYIFSLFNKGGEEDEKTMSVRGFFLVNLVAGILRTIFTWYIFLRPIGYPFM